jgi:hypothetical protein
VVVASVRHENTAYDQLLMAGVDRAAARAQDQPDVDHVLAAWRRDLPHGAQHPAPGRHP